LEDVGLPLLRSGDNLFQVARFQLSAAKAFMKRSGLDLQSDALDRLLTSAAELDDTPGLVRPITLNVIGYVLASGKAVALSLEAGALVRHYIEQTVGNPIIRDLAPRMLEQMITEEGTKLPRSEQDLAAMATLRPAEVRGILNDLAEAGLARPLNPTEGVWELSHDFIARGVARFLGRRRGQPLQRAVAYAAPALLVIGLLGGVWVSQSYLKEQVNWYWAMLPYKIANVNPYVLTAEAERALKPKDSFRECAKDCPEMIVVPAGDFTMGSPATEQGRYDTEGPQHTVMIARPFAVSKFDVTFADWDACVSVGGCPRASDSGFGRGTKPVINVTWDEAQQYVAWFSKMTGQPYRLLTEAEWEYAARAGTTTTYPWGDEIGKGNANCTGCGSKWDNQETSPVGSFKPNAFGLYDMHGNVWQWVEDCYEANYSGAPTDGSAWTTGDCNQRVLRGGAWSYNPQLLRSASRDGDSSDARNRFLGFRVGRTLTP
jgi:formylglycine-generating enzyme required for sulfatase activity